MNHQALVGKRARHNCGDPKCDMEGIIVAMLNQPGFTAEGEFAVWWAIVKWTTKLEGVDETPMALHMLTVMEAG